MKRILRAVAAVIGAVGLCAAALWGALQSPAAKKYLARELSKKLSGPHTTVRLETLSGWLPFEIELSRLEVADAQGVWFTAHDLVLNWRFSALLQGRFFADLVSARQVHLERLPQATPSSPEGAEPRRGVVPFPPIPIIVSKIFLHQVIVDAPVLGSPLTAALEGSVAYDPKDRVQKAIVKMVTNHNQRESSLTLQAVLQERDPQLSGNLTFFEQENGWVTARFALKNFGDLHARMHLHLETSKDPSGTLQVDALQVQTQPFSLSAHGGFRFSDGVVEPTTFHVDLQNLEPLAARRGLSLQGTAKLEGTVEGPLSHMIGRLTMRLDSIDSPSWKLSQGRMHWQWVLQQEAALPFPEISVEFYGEASAFEIPWASAPALHDMRAETSARLTRQGRVEIQKLHLHVTDLGETELHGHLDLPQRRAHMASVLHLFDLSLFSFLTPEPMAGNLRGNVTLSGSWDNMTVLTTMSGTGLGYGTARWNDWNLDLNGTGFPQNPKGKLTTRAVGDEGPWHLEMEFAKDGSVLQLPRFTFQYHDAVVQGSLRTHLETFLAAGILDVSIPRLDIFQPLWHQEIRGGLRGTVTLSDDGERQRFQGNLTGRSLVYNDVFVDALDVSAQAEGLFPSLQGTVSLRLKDFQKPPLKLAQAQAHAEGTMQEMTFSTQMQGTFRYPFALSSTASARVGSAGKEIRLETLSARSGAVDIQLESPAKIVMDREHVETSAMAFRVGEGRVVAHGQWSGEKPSVALKVQNLPLELIEHFGGPSIQGRLNANAMLRRHGNNPEASANLQLESLRHPAWPTSETFSAEASLRADAQTLRLEASLSGLGSESSRAQLAVPIRFHMDPLELDLVRNAPMTGTLALDIALERMGSLLELEAHRIHGTVRGQVHLDGTLNRPLFGGELLLSNGRYEHEDLGIVLSQITAVLEGSKDLLRVREFQAFDGKKGSIRGSGACRLDADVGFPWNAQVTLEEVSPLHRDDVSGNLNGTLTAQGTLRETALAGNIRVRPLRIELPKRLPPNVVVLDVEEIKAGAEGPSVRPPKKSSSPSHRVSTNLALELPNLSIVSPWGLEAEWKGTLHITGNASEPHITGRLDLTRGRLDFLNRIFRLTQGYIAFYGESPPNPAIDLLGEITLRDMTAQVRLTGRAANPQLTLSSMPQRPQEEILSQILFGRGATTLSPLQALRLAGTLQALSTRAGSDLNVMEKTRNLLGLDQLELLGAGLGEGLGVGLRKYLGENVTVDVDQRLEEGDVALRVEVEITPNITLETQVGTHSRTGGGIFWKYDY